MRIDKFITFDLTYHKKASQYVLSAISRSQRGEGSAGSHLAQFGFHSSTSANWFSISFILYRYVHWLQEKPRSVHMSRNKKTNGAGRNSAKRSTWTEQVAQTINMAWSFFGVATLLDWWENLTLLFEPIRSKFKTFQHTFSRDSGTRFTSGSDWPVG